MQYQCTLKYWVKKYKLQVIMVQVRYLWLQSLPDIILLWVIVKYSIAWFKLISMWGIWFLTKEIYMLRRLTASNVKVAWIKVQMYQSLPFSIQSKIVSSLNWGHRGKVLNWFGQKLTREGSNYYPFLKSWYLGKTRNSLCTHSEADAVFFLSKY